MKTKFTKGNWHVHQEGTSIHVWSDKPGEGRICTTMDRNKQEQTANATLIATAPEMYQALQELIHAIQFRTAVGHELIHELIQAKEVLEKAKQ